jgi:hypothetical protein
MPGSLSCKTLWLKLGRAVLTKFQLEVARVFFTLPVSAHFLIAGGAALLANELSERRTQDIDLFTRQVRHVGEARDQFERAAKQEGWSTNRILDEESMCRLSISGTEELIIDFCVYAPPRNHPTVTFLDPTFAPLELAAHKLIALWDRAAARDFVDVFVLAKSFHEDEILKQAKDLDHGLNDERLANQFGELHKYSDTDLPIGADSVPALRQFFHDWSVRLRAGD